MPRLPALALVTLAAVALAQPQPKLDLPAVNPGNAKLLRAVDGLGSPATSVAFDAGKGLIVVGCEDGTLRLGPADGGKLQTLPAHGSAVTAAACAAGRTASASSDGKVCLWNLPAAKPMHTLAHGSPVRAVAVAIDGKAVASAGDDGRVQLWDGAGKAVRKLAGPTDWLFAVAFSADGKFVAAAGQDGRLWLWEAGTGRKVFDVPSSPPAPKGTEAIPNVVSALAFAPDGKTLASGGSDGKIYVHQATDGKLVRTLTGHTHAVTGLVYHPAGQLLVSSSRDRTVRLWNPVGGNPIKALEGHTAWIDAVTLADKGTRAVSAGADRTLRVWDLGAVSVKPKK